MKRSVGTLLLVFAWEALAYSDNQLANEVAFTERVLSTQLRHDKAPENLIKEETSLLKQAEKAVQSKVEMRGRGTSFLANRAHSSTEASQELAAKVGKDIEFASKAVEVQLEQNHAPASLVQNEKQLLAKAFAAAKDAQHMLGKALTLKDRERSLEARSHSKIKEEQTVDARDKAAQALTAEEQEVAKEVKERLKDTQYVKNQAQKALAQLHTDSATQKRVADLLAKAENAERSELALSQHALSMANNQHMISEVGTTKRVGKDASIASTLEAESSKAGVGALNAIVSQEEGLLKNERSQLHEVLTIKRQAETALKQVNASPKTQQSVNRLLNILEHDNRQLINTEGESLRSTLKFKELHHSKKAATQIQTEEQRLAKLESRNAKLLSKNEKLHAEHTMLIREEEVAEQNQALMKENFELQNSNAKLNEELANTP